MATSHDEGTNARDTLEAATDQLRPQRMIRVGVLLQSSAKEAPFVLLFDFYNAAFIRNAAGKTCKAPGLQCFFTRFALCFDCTRALSVIVIVRCDREPRVLGVFFHLSFVG